MTHEEYVSSIRASALSIGTEAVISYVAKNYPFFFIPILNPITSLIIKKVVSILINETEIALFFGYIDLRSSHEGEVFSTMAYKHQVAIKSGNETEIIIARENLENAFRNLAKFNR